MAIIKCKMCGGDLNIEAGMTVAECEYCGTRQTVPTADNEKKLTLFARANRLRAACEFDKAASVYESIVAEFPTEAEAYWGLVLCRYGIEYVDDPATGKKIPTCHRSSFESILEDPDFEQAQENADAVSRKVYREEAKAIEDIRRRIVELSGKEQPYDVFICYKETDENGERTPDSVMAQEVYDALTEKGLRVFFSRITLEDKLGTEYEPYIFAALNSAKVMLVFGTDYEYFNAVWVKNEWSRFLALIAAGQKKALIPCYKGVDAYDMPKEFAHLQGQDMGKLGAVQDLVRGVEKLLGKGAAQAAQPAQPVIVQAAGGGTADTLVARGNMALEDGEWQKANDFFEQALNIDPQKAEAYLGVAMGKAKAHSREEYREELISLRHAPDKAFERARQFAQGELQDWLEDVQKCMDMEQKKRIAEEEARRERKRIEREKRIAEEKARRERERIEREQHILKLKEAREKISPARALVSAGSNRTVGLKSDGTVVAVGSNYSGQCDVADWRDIVAVSAGLAHTVGLKSDGTVVATKFIEGKYITYDGQCEVADWTDIVAVSAGYRHTVGLKSDGTVVAVGRNDFGQCGVADRRDIVAVSAGNGHTVGLKSDGTVLAVGWNYYGQCDVADWRDIVAVSAGPLHTVGLKSDGTVVAVGVKSYGQCDVKRWKLFNDFSTLEEERAEQARLAEQARQQRLAALAAEETRLQNELASLRGLFTGKRRREIEERLAAIRSEKTDLTKR